MPGATAPQTETKATNGQTPPEQPQEPSGNPEERPTLIQSARRQIDSFLSRGLKLPPDYSPENALVQAKLALQNVSAKVGDKYYPVMDPNGRPFRLADGSTVVSEASMVAALVDMLVQGMNVGKKQAAFVVYDRILTMQRMIPGEVLLAKRAMWPVPIEPYWDFVSEAEMEGFSAIKQRSSTGFRTVINTHPLRYPRDVKNIALAYFGAINLETGEDMGCLIMGIEEIHTSWKKSKTWGKIRDKQGNIVPTFHDEQPDQACIRTVGRRWSKPIISASDDKLLLAAVQRQEDAAVFGAIEEDANLNANAEVLTLSQSAESVVDASGFFQQTDQEEPEKVLVGAGASSGSGSANGMPEME